MHSNQILQTVFLFTIYLSEVTAIKLTIHGPNLKGYGLTESNLNSGHL